MSDKMLLRAVVLLVVLGYMVSSSPFMTNKAAADEPWPDLEDLLPKFKEKTPPDRSANTPCPPLKLPQFQQISSSDVYKPIFKPSRTRRPVPEVMKAILLPTPPPVTVTPASSRQKNIELLCHIDRIYVRVVKSLFVSPDAGKYLKVGTCAVNKATLEYYYFLYTINSCDAQRNVRISHWLNLQKNPTCILCFYLL